VLADALLPVADDEPNVESNEAMLELAVYPFDPPYVLYMLALVLTGGGTTSKPNPPYPLDGVDEG
jgi:hypothetical protein